jgi:trigger factor
VSLSTSSARRRTVTSFSWTTKALKTENPFEDTKKTENFVIKLGDAHISEDFDKGVVGMNPGDEKEITTSFPEDYFNKKLAGHTVDFKVKLNEIRKEVLPEIDDEMAKQLGPVYHPRRGQE